MSEYNINKGIGRPAEFRGLQSQYLFLFAGGLLAVFVVLVVMFMAGLNPFICILFGGGTATTLVWLTFSLNRKHGPHGLMKVQAKMSRPRFLINRRRLTRLLLPFGEAGRGFHKTPASCEAH